jgi:hypothetical protein
VVPGAGDTFVGVSGQWTQPVAYLYEADGKTPIAAMQLQMVTDTSDSVIVDGLTQPTDKRGRALIDVRYGKPTPPGKVAKLTITSQDDPNVTQTVNLVVLPVTLTVRPDKIQLESGATTNDHRRTITVHATGPNGAPAPNVEMQVSFADPTVASQVNAQTIRTNNNGDATFQVQGDKADVTTMTIALPLDLSQRVTAKVVVDNLVT